MAIALTALCGDPVDWTLLVAGSSALSSLLVRVSRLLPMCYIFFLLRVQCSPAPVLCAGFYPTEPRDSRGNSLIFAMHGSKNSVASDMVCIHLYVA